MPKLPSPEGEDLEAGIIDAINMDSYRPAKQSTEKISLVAEPGYVNPIPVGVSVGLPEPEYDTLEHILSNFNHRFGDIDWTNKDKVNEIITQQISADIPADSKVIDDIINSPDKQNAKTASDKKVEKLMQEYLFTQTEIFKKFSADKDFERRYKKFIFDSLWQTNKQPVINL